MLASKKEIEHFLDLANVAIWENASVVEAQFEVYFSGWNYTRKVMVRPPSEVQFKRDRRGRLIEQWLTRRRLCLCQEQEHSMAIN